MLHIVVLSFLLRQLETCSRSGSPCPTGRSDNTAASRTVAVSAALGAAEEGHDEDEDVVAERRRVVEIETSGDLQVILDEFDTRCF